MPTFAEKEKMREKEVDKESKETGKEKGKESSIEKPGREDKERLINNFLKNHGFKDLIDFYNKFDHLKKELFNKPAFQLSQEEINILKDFTYLLATASSLHNFFLEKAKGMDKQLTEEQKVQSMITALTTAINLRGYKPGITKTLADAIKTKSLDCDSASFILGSLILLETKNKANVSINYIIGYAFRDNEQLIGNVGHALLNVKIGNNNYLIEATEMINPTTYVNVNNFLLSAFLSGLQKGLGFLDIYFHACKSALENKEVFKEIVKNVENNSLFYEAARTIKERYVKAGLIRNDEKIKIYYTNVSSPSKEEKGKTIEI